MQLENDGRNSKNWVTICMYIYFIFLEDFKRNASGNFLTMNNTRNMKYLINYKGNRIQNPWWYFWQLLFYIQLMKGKMKRKEKSKSKKDRFLFIFLEACVSLDNSNAFLAISFSVVFFLKIVNFFLLFETTFLTKN